MLTLLLEMTGRQKGEKGGMGFYFCGIRLPLPRLEMTLAF